MEYYNILEVLNFNTLERIYIHNIYIYNYFINMRIWRTEKTQLKWHLKTQLQLLT